MYALVPFHKSPLAVMDGSWIATASIRVTPMHPFLVFFDTNLKIILLLFTALLRRIVGWIIYPSLGVMGDGVLWMITHDSFKTTGSILMMIVLSLGVTTN